MQYFAQLGSHSDTFQMAPAGASPHHHECMLLRHTTHAVSLSPDLQC